MSLQSIKSAVNGASSEKAQVNAVVAELARSGVSKAAHPEVHSTTVDRSTFRIYLWRNIGPGGDALVLATGPSFQPAVLLGSQIPADTGPGVYVKALIAEGVKPLAGANKVVSRIEKAAAKVEKTAAKVERAAKTVEKQATKVEAKAAKVERAAQRVEAAATPAPAPVYHAPTPAPVHHAPTPAGGLDPAELQRFIAMLKGAKTNGRFARR